MLYSASVEQHKVEDLSSFANVFVPLSQSSSSSLCLRRQILKQTQEALVLDVGSLSFDQLLNFFQIVEDFMWLLHIVLVRCLKHTSFPLLIVEKAQLDLDVHWIFKLLNSLLHGAKVACEVVL